MVQTIRHVIEVSLGAYKTTPRTSWVQEWPGQVVLCVSQIFWTAEVHENLHKKSVTAIKSYHSHLHVSIRTFLITLKFFKLKIKYSQSTFVNTTNILFFVNDIINNVTDQS